MKWLHRLLTAPSDERERLDLIDERRAAASLYGPRMRVQAAPQYPPVTYPDGSRDELCEDLDVFADAATPGGPMPEAA